MGEGGLQSMRAVDRAYYHATIAEFLGHGDSHILAELTRHSPFAVETTQVAAWSEQVDILRRVFGSLGAPGSVYFEFTVPRVGRRVSEIVGNTVRDGKTEMVEVRESGARD